MSKQQAADIHPVDSPECYLCSSPGKIVYEGLTDRLFGTPGSWGFKQCVREECGLVWLDPHLSEAELGRAYDEYYTHTGDQSHPRIAFFFFRLFHSWQRLSGLVTERSKLSLMALDEIPPGRLLDIGSGTGHFLHRMSELGWSVTGMDMDPAAARGASERYDVSVLQGSIRDHDFEPGSFDAISLSHVIEHVHDPIELLQRCREALATNGRLVIVTPNAGSLGHRRFGRDWRGLEPPRHLHLFSEQTMRRCVETAGLRTRTAWTSAVNASFVFLASMALRHGEPFRPGLKGEPIARLARASWFSLVESHRNRRDAWLGEELVVEAER